MAHLLLEAFCATVPQCNDFLIPDIYTVVIDPILTGLFVHEAFGHLSEADMAYENPDFLEVMSMGKRFGSEDLQIFDGAAPLESEQNYIHRGSYF